MDLNLLRTEMGTVIISSAMFLTIWWDGFRSRSCWGCCILRRRQRGRWREAHDRSGCAIRGHYPDPGALERIGQRGALLGRGLGWAMNPVALRTGSDRQGSRFGSKRCKAWLACRLG